MESIFFVSGKRILVEFYWNSRNFIINSFFDNFFLFLLFFFFFIFLNNRQFVDSGVNYVSLKYIINIYPCLCLYIQSWRNIEYVIHSRCCVFSHLEFWIKISGRSRNFQKICLQDKSRHPVNKFLAKLYIIKNFVIGFISLIRKENKNSLHVKNMRYFLYCLYGQIRSHACYMFSVSSRGNSIIELCSVASLRFVSHPSQFSYERIFLPDTLESFTSDRHLVALELWCRKSFALIVV